MTDPRYTKLAKMLVEYSTALKKGDRVLLDMIDVPDEFSIELMRAARAAGATPIIEVRHTRINREMLRATNDQHARLVRDLELFRMKKMQAYIAIRGSGNASENADVASDRMALYSRTTRPVLNYRVSKTRWCVLRWPTPSMAQAAGMSTEAFEDLYFDVCTMDYRKMARAMVPLERRMKQADRVHIKGPGTDLDLQHQRHRREDVQGRPEHPRWRSVLLPGQGLDQRPHPVQHADPLLGDEVRERLPGIQGREDREGTCRTTRGA